MAMKKIKLVKVLNTGKVKKGDIVLVTPSNLDGGKKDIYATTMNNHSIGRVTTKDNGSSFVSRDTLRGQLSIGDFLTAEVVSKSKDGITLKILTKDSIGHINIDTYASKGIPTDQLSMIKDKVVNGGLGSSCSKKQGVPKKEAVIIKKDKIEKTPKLKEATIIAKATNSKGDDTMKKQNGMMDTIFGGKFGAVKTDEFKLGANGSLAVQTEGGKYISLDTTGEFPVLKNTTSFTFEFGKVFVIPTEATKVVKGDVVIKDNAVYFVTSTRDGRIQGINPITSTTVDLVSTQHVMMNKEFVRVVKTMFDFLPQDDKKNPADLMSNPLMLMVALNGEDKENGKSKMKDLMMMNMMNQGGDIASNPMAMMLMMKDGGDMKDMMLPMLLNQGGDIASNPMLLMALAGDGGDMKDMLPMLMMNGGLGGKDGAKPTGVEAMLPMLMMGDGDIDPMMLLMMTGGLGGEQAGGMNAMLPLMLMGDKKGGKGGIDPMMLMAMNGGFGGEQGGDLMSNPMMLMALMGDGSEGGIDPMMMMAMGGFGAQTTKKAEVVVGEDGDKVSELAKTVEDLIKKNEELTKTNQELVAGNQD